VKDAPAIVGDTLRSPPRAKDVQVISVDGLVTDRIVAIGRRQSLAGSGGRSVQLGVVVEEITDIEDVPLVEDVRDFSDGLVVVVDLQDGVQLFGLQAELLFYLIDAGCTGTHAAGDYRGSPE